VAVNLRAQTFWLVDRARKLPGGHPSVQALIDTLKPTVEALRAAGPDLLSPYERKGVEAKGQALVKAGAPAAVARDVAALSVLRSAVEISGLAAESGWAPEEAARVFHAVAQAFGFDRLRGAAMSLPPGDPFEARAVRQLVIELVDEQTDVAAKVVRAAAGPPADAAAAAAAVAAWSEPRRAAVDRAARTLAEIEESPEPWSFAKLTIAHAALRAVGA
jgi:glutamate dehydrogenase